MLEIAHEVVQMVGLSPATSLPQDMDSLDPQRVYKPWRRAAVSFCHSCPYQSVNMLNINLIVLNEFHTMLAKEAEK